MTITNLQKARHRLTYVYFGEERFAIDTETLLLSGYRVGDTLTSEQWDQLQKQAQYNRAYEKALYLLEYRAHSRGELYQKISREYEKEATLQALERVEALGLINDLDFATRLAEELTTQKGYGKARVKADLQRRGIDRELIAQVLEQLPQNQEEACKCWMQKKCKTPPATQKEQEKLLAGAVRRGFDFATARAVLKEIVAQESEDASWQFE